MLSYEFQKKEDTEIKEADKQALRLKELKKELEDKTEQLESKSEGMG